MKKNLSTAGMLVALLAAGLMTAESRAAGAFYGLWWDGSAEQFVTVDPYTASKTVLKAIPGVRYLSLGGSYTFDPDSSRYAFVGLDASQASHYYVINAPTGDLIGAYPKNDTIRSLIYNPRDKKAYGLSWSDSSLPAPPGPLTPYDSAMRYEAGLHGKEYFVSIDPATGARSNTYIPGAKYIRVNSQFLNPDSGRYVFAGQEDGGAQFYYVIDITTGALITKIPHTMKIDNPVYNPSTGAVHGLWWSDSSYYPASDTLDTLAHWPGPKILAGTEYFVTLNPDSSMTTVALTGVKYITMNYTFDPDEQRYIFVGKGATGPTRYYVVDAETGALLSQTAVAEKVDNLAYARISSTVDPSYFATAVTARIGGAQGVRVNAFAGFLTLDAPGAAGKDLSFSIRDLSGKVLLLRNGIQGGRARIDLHGVQNGLYLYQIRSDRAILGAGKVLIRR